MWHLSWSDVRVSNGGGCSDGTQRWDNSSASLGCAPPPRCAGWASWQQRGGRRLDALGVSSGRLTRLFVFSCSSRDTDSGPLMTTGVLLCPLTCPSQLCSVASRTKVTKLGNWHLHDAAWSQNISLLTQRWCRLLSFDSAHYNAACIERSSLSCGNERFRPELRSIWRLSSFPILFAFDPRILQSSSLFLNIACLPSKDFHKALES